MSEPVAPEIREKAAASNLSPEDILRLVEAARDVSLRAYAPYSKYSVGAALLADDGSIIGGCNVENASYGLTVCAERSAVCAAVAKGHKQMRAIAVVTADNGSPCGACRQFLLEFNPQMLIVLASPTGIHSAHTAQELLPHGFRLERFSQ